MTQRAFIATTKIFFLYFGVEPIFNIFVVVVIASPIVLKHFKVLIDFSSFFLFIVLFSSYFKQKIMLSFFIL